MDFQFHKGIQELSSNFGTVDSAADMYNAPFMVGTVFFINQCM